MIRKPTFTSLITTILLLLTLTGCAHPPQLPPGTLPESIRPGYDVVYKPAIDTAQTSDAIQQELISSIEYLDLDPDDFPPFPLRGTGTRILEDKIAIGWTTLPITPERSGTVILPFYKLLTAKILVEYRKEGPGRLRYEIRFPELVTLKFADFSDARKVADGLLHIQNREKQITNERNNRLAAFEPVAAQYRALATKPKLAEEQRKVIVQANAFSQQKNYQKAIEKYLVAIDIDPVTYPAAYHNLALLQAQENDLVLAIFYMKHYLLLAPDAADSRAAQDKIYEWEAMMENPAQPPKRSHQ